MNLQLGYVRHEAKKYIVDNYGKKEEGGIRLDHGLADESGEEFDSFVDDVMIYLADLCPKATREQLESVFKKAYGEVLDG